MNAEAVNILIVGVGGQGTILAGKIISQVMLDLGQDVKISEIHGMAQRGGSVVTQVRCAAKVYAPVVAPGEADIILALERLEALRWCACLKQGGMLIVNDQALYPLPVITGEAVYPDDIVSRLEKLPLQVMILEAWKIARDCGNQRAVNTVLLGVLAARLGQEQRVWRKALEAQVAPRFQEVNICAFNQGYDWALARRN